MISVKNYLHQAQVLMDNGEPTDGCTLTQFMHKILSKAELLCAAHDYGSLDLIMGIDAGIENNLMTWFAHMANWNPVYWIWGTIVAVFTLPWVVWRRNLGIKFLSFLGFHAVLISIIAFSIIFYVAE